MRTSETSKWIIFGNHRMEKSFGRNSVCVEPNCKWQCDIVMHNWNCDTAYRTSPMRPNSVNISLSGLLEDGSCPRNDACELRSNLRKYTSVLNRRWCWMSTNSVSIWPRYYSDGPGIDSQWCHWGFFPCYPRQNHVPWGRLSLWQWVPGISSAFGRRPTTAYHHKSRRFKLKYNELRDCVNIDFKILFTLIYL